MPMYEFECQKCGVRTDKLIKRDESHDKITCPKCGGEAINVPATSAAHFKGAGWTPKHH
jgi:putative FmdB family regulatory protein